FAADTTIATLMARIDRAIEVPEALGPLRRPLERAGTPSPEDRLDASGFGVALMAVAEQLPRPDPLPLAGAMPPVEDALAEGDDDRTILSGAAVPTVVEPVAGGPVLDDEGTTVTAPVVPGASGADDAVRHEDGIG